MTDRTASGEASFNISLSFNIYNIINFLHDTCFLYAYIYVVLFCIIIHACCDGVRLLVGNKQPITYNVTLITHFVRNKSNI
jgi:hypothetical protein